MAAIRAVYEHGQLRLLDRVDLQEGQQVHIEIMSEREAILAALDDLIMPQSDEILENIDEEALMNEIKQAFRGTRPLSEIIIEERDHQL